MSGFISWGTDVYPIYHFFFLEANTVAIFNSVSKYSSIICGLSVSIQINEHVNN